MIFPLDEDLKRFCFRDIVGTRAAQPDPSRTTVPTGLLYRAPLFSRVMVKAAPLAVRPASACLSEHRGLQKCHLA